ncbi:MAG: BrnT family toxin [Gammaproteobacteria bacterium]|jgi:hypothetical protein
MDISYDPDKSERNIAERGLSFELVVFFDWASAVIKEDSRNDFGELRFQALGFIGDRLHMVIYTPRDPCAHVISLRKANQREIKRYETQTQP